ncbi:MAG TPA: hypothetical protein VFX24_09740 [Ktedonobacterales bacterium]|nr:hypothetical protein [Ktedonobacterales bacterium]
MFAVFVRPRQCADNVRLIRSEPASGNETNVLGVIVRSRTFGAESPFFSHLSEHLLSERAEQRVKDDAITVRGDWDVVVQARISKRTSSEGIDAALSIAYIYCLGDFEYGVSPDVIGSEYRENCEEMTVVV